MKKSFYLVFVVGFALLAWSCTEMRTEIRQPGLSVKSLDPEVAKTVLNSQKDYTALPAAVAEALKKNPQGYVKVSADEIVYDGNPGANIQKGVWENLTRGYIEVTIRAKGSEEIVAQFVIQPEKGKNFQRLSLEPGNYVAEIVSSGGIETLAFKVDTMKANACSERVGECFDFAYYSR